MSLTPLPFVLGTLSPSNSPFSELPTESVRVLRRNRTHRDDFKELSHTAVGWASPNPWGSLVAQTGIDTAVWSRMSLSLKNCSFALKVFN